MDAGVRTIRADFSVLRIAILFDIRAVYQLADSKWSVDVFLLGVDSRRGTVEGNNTVAVLLLIPRAPFQVTAKTWSLEVVYSALRPVLRERSESIRGLRMIVETL